MAELGVLALEGFEDADGAVGVQHPLAVLLDELELSRRGIVEGQDDGVVPRRTLIFPSSTSLRATSRYAALPESLEVTAEIGGRARPALLGQVNLVVLEDHDAPELVRRKIASQRPPRAGAPRPRAG